MLDASPVRYQRVVVISRRVLQTPYWNHKKKKLKTQLKPVCFLEKSGWITTWKAHNLMRCRLLFQWQRHRHDSEEHTRSTSGLSVQQLCCCGCIRHHSLWGPLQRLKTKNLWQTHISWARICQVGLMWGSTGVEVSKRTGRIENSDKASLSGVNPIQQPCSAMHAAKESWKCSSFCFSYMYCSWQLCLWRLPSVSGRLVDILSSFGETTPSDKRHFAMSVPRWPQPMIPTDRLYTLDPPRSCDFTVVHLALQMMLFDLHSRDPRITFFSDPEKFCLFFFTLRSREFWVSWPRNLRVSFVLGFPGWESKQKVISSIFCEIIVILSLKCDLLSWNHWHANIAMALNPAECAFVYWRVPHAVLSRNVICGGRICNF